MLRKFLKIDTLRILSDTYYLYGAKWRNSTALWVLLSMPQKTRLKQSLRFLDMAVWTVTCTDCNLSIEHSQIVQESLSELFFPTKPDVSSGATIKCLKCGNVVSYVRTDLRYISDDTRESESQD